MSFNQTYEGKSKAEVLEKLDAYPAELEANDKKFTAGALVIAAHQRQCVAAISAVKKALADVPEETPYVKAGVTGYANFDGEGKEIGGGYGYTVQVSGLPTPGTD